MKDGWEVKRIKDICEKASSNVTQQSLKDNTGDYPIYGASGFIKNVNFYHQDKDYIGIVKDGSGIGRTMLLPSHSSVIGTIQYILPKKPNKLKFVYYALESLDLAQYKNGAAIPHIYFRDYGESIIAVPSLSEQERIVSILDSAFAKIEAMKDNAARNLANAKELFQSELQNAMKPKEGWEIKKLGEVCHSFNGLWTGKKEPFIKVSVIRNANFTKSFSLDYTNVVNIDVESRAFQNKQLRTGDIIVERSGGTPKQPVGRVVLFEKENGLFSLSNFTSALRLKKDTLMSRFLYDYLVHFYLCGGTIPMQSHSTGIRNLDFKRYMEVAIPIPPLLTQQRIVSHLDALSEKVKELEAAYNKTIADCEELKQSLLRQAFNGEL